MIVVEAILIIVFCVGCGMVFMMGHLGTENKPALTTADVFRSQAVEDLEWQYARGEITIEQFEQRLNNIVADKPKQAPKPKGVLQIDTGGKSRNERVRREILSAYRVPPHRIVVAERRPEFVFPVDGRSRILQIDQREEDFEVDRPPVNFADNIYKALHNNLITENEARELMEELVHRRNYGSWVPTTVFTTKSIDK